MLTKDDLQAIETIVGNKIESQLEPVKKDMKQVKRDISRIKKDINYMVDKFDENDVKLSRRVTRIENHLELPPIQ